MDRKEYARLINEWAESGRDWQFKWPDGKWVDTDSAPIPGDDLSRWQLKPEPETWWTIRNPIDRMWLYTNLEAAESYHGRHADFMRVREVTDDDKPKRVMWMQQFQPRGFLGDTCWIECDEDDPGAVRVEMEG